MFEVRKYDYKNRRYVQAANGASVPVTIRTGAELDEYLIDKFKSKSSAAKRSYMEVEGIHLSDVYEQVGGIAPGKLSGTKVRAILTDENLRPWFGPTTEEGFRLGLQEVQDQWEPLIGTTVPVDTGSAEWYNLVDPESSDAFALKSISQGAQIPVAILTVARQPVVLEKKGRGLQWTYEAQRAPIGLAQLWLRVLGMRIGRSYLGLTAARAVNGYLDDNSDDPIIVNTATSGVFTLFDLLTARYTLSEVYGFEATDIMISLSAFIGLLTLQHSVSGNLVFPDGIASIKEILMVQDVHIINALTNSQIVFLNRGAALIRYVTEEFATEDDRVPGQQLLATYGTLTDQITPGIKNSRLVLNAAW